MPPQSAQALWGGVGTMLAIAGLARQCRRAGVVADAAYLSSFPALRPISPLLFRAT